MTSATNRYCEALGITLPNLELAKDRSDANSYSLLIVALLERGEPITLGEAAVRFEAAGVAPREEALASLKRCRPARPPIYRDGDHYALDPYDDGAALWAFRLGLRPPRAAPLRLVRSDPGPLPCADHPLTTAHLDEAWRDGIPNSWSAQRIAICVLDAHGRAMKAEDVLEFVRKHSQFSLLSADSENYWRQGAPIRVRENGFWELNAHHKFVSSARLAIRQRIETARKWAHMRTDPVEFAVIRKRIQREQQAHAEELSRMRRVLVHAFPSKKPEAIVLLDVQARELHTFLGPGISAGVSMLADYDIIAGIDVRVLLRKLGVDPGQRRLGELGPPQKTRQLNQRGRTLKITTKLLIQGSCGIGRPFADAKVLRGYLDGGHESKLCRRLEADAKSLFALYEYGRLHGSVRLRWGFLDERLPVPWVHRDETTLYGLQRQALEKNVPLEVIVGQAPGWDDPWARRQLAFVERERDGWRSWMVDENGYALQREEIQRARVLGS